MSSDVTVRTEDLGEVLDYLEGLLLVLQTFEDERRGVQPDRLTRELVKVGGYQHAWEPLRYQEGGAGGWDHVHGNVEDLRGRLMEPYSNAALAQNT